MDKAVQFIIKINVSLGILITCLLENVWIF